MIYIATSENMVFMNVTNLSSPTPVATLEIMKDGNLVKISDMFLASDGATMFFACYEYGIYIYSVGNPS